MFTMSVNITGVMVNFLKKTTVTEKLEINRGETLEGFNYTNFVLRNIVQLQQPL